MRSSYRKKLEDTITDLTHYLERDYSSKFKHLTPKEDRQLFFLATILTKLKNISKEIKEEEKILIFPTLKQEKISKV